MSTDPKALTPNYKSTRFRSPQKPLVVLPGTLANQSSPVFGQELLGALDHDLINNFAQKGQSAIGPRIEVQGRIVDENGRGVSAALIEIWQANSAGRYRHKNDRYLAPLDPNFAGCGRTISDNQGFYRFLTVQPGAYPWLNHTNAWRPQHIHFSVFGTSFIQRLVTQMYFEGDPLIAHCPIVQAIPDAEAIDRLTAKLDLDQATSMDRLAYRFDIVLRGPNRTFLED